MTHIGDPRFDTADFSDVAPGNLRADYVLPRKNLSITDAEISGRPPTIRYLIW
jgi:3-phytase